MKKFISLPWLLLFLFTLKIMFLGASLADSIAIAAISALTGFCFYVEDTREEPINDQIKAQLEFLKTEQDVLKNTIMSLKLGQSLRK